MINRISLQEIIRNAIVKMGGNGTIVAVAKYIWENHENDLKDSGDVFYTWQYDMRWAAMKLREKDILKQASDSPKGVWILK